MFYILEIEETFEFFEQMFEEFLEKICRDPWNNCKRALLHILCRLQIHL